MIGNMQKQLKDALVIESSPSKSSDNVASNSMASNTSRMERSEPNVVNPFARTEEKTEEKPNKGGWFSRNRS
jgi:hypothetical protein